MNQLKKNLIDDFGYQNPKVPATNNKNIYLPFV